MPGFKSADLKQAAEELWAGGVVISASALAQLYRAGELDELLSRFRQIRAEETWLDNRIAFLERQIPQLEAALWQQGPAQKRAVDLWELNRRLHQRLTVQETSLANQLSATESRLWTLRRGLSQLAGRISALADAIRMTSMALLYLEPCTTDYHQAKERLASMQREMADLRWARDRIQEEVANLEGRARELEASIQDVRAALSQVRRNIDYWDAEAKRHASAARRIAQELARLRAELEELRRRREG